MRGIIFQSVVVALALVLLAPPGAALVACLPHGGPAPMNCCSGMRTHGAPAAQVAARDARPCCEISSGRPVAPLAASAAPSAFAQVAPATAILAMTVPAVPVARAGQDAIPKDHGASPQAVLCTFLI